MSKNTAPVATDTPRTVLGLDPGTRESALVGWDGTRVTSHYHLPNEVLLQHLGYRAKLDKAPPILVIEQIESMGMRVGRDVFETVFWSGRFFQAWGLLADRITRRAVKMHLCGQMRAKDPDIRQAIWDRVCDPYIADRATAVGTKAAQGPLYGISGHKYAALGVAITYWDQRLAAALSADESSAAAPRARTKKG